MSYLIPILIVLFILACMAKRLNDEYEEENNYDDTTRYQDKVVSSIYSSAQTWAENKHEHCSTLMNQEEEFSEDNFDNANENIVTESDTNMNNENISQMSDQTTQKEDYNLEDLIIDVLTKLGCQPEKEEDNIVIVKYQGETFTISVGRRFARIWDLGWSGINADDPKLPMLKDAVNMCNFQPGPTIVLTSPNDEGIIYIHSHYDIMLHPACNENIEFLNAVLDYFFKTKDNLYRHINLMDLNNN